MVEPQVQLRCSKLEETVDNADELKLGPLLGGVGSAAGALCHDCIVVVPAAALGSGAHAVAPLSSMIAIFRLAWCAP